MSKWFSTALEERKLVRRSLLVWMVSLITFATYMLFNGISAPTVVHGSAYAVLTAMLMPIAGLYMWQRYQEKGNVQPTNGPS